MGRLTHAFLAALLTAAVIATVTAAGGDGPLVKAINTGDAQAVRALFPERKDAVSLGLQQERIGDSQLFVLPNPSGRNANYSYAEMVAAFRALARFARRNGRYP